MNPPQKPIIPTEKPAGILCFVLSIIPFMEIFLMHLRRVSSNILVFDFQKWANERIPKAKNSFLKST